MDTSILFCVFLECTDGTYISNRVCKECPGHCNNDAFCNKETGTCDNGCKNHWIGYVCDRMYAKYLCNNFGKKKIANNHIVSPLYILYVVFLQILLILICNQNSRLSCHFAIF